jgi:hypothetical protein
MSNQKKEDIPEKIKQVAIDTIKHELITSKIKEAAIQELNKQILEMSNQKKEDIPEKIKQVAIDTIKHELVTSQIKETAIQSVQIQLKKEQKGLTEEEIKNLAKQIILNLIKTYLPSIQTIIAIKKAAIEAVKKNTVSIEDQLIELLDDFEGYNEIIFDTNKNEQERKKAEEEKKQTLEKYEELVNTISDKDKQIPALQNLLKKYQELNNSNKILNEQTNGRLQTEILELKQSILQNELKNVAINKVLESLPKVAEPKIDIKPLIENAAINKVKDALNDAVINDLKTKLGESETKLNSSIEANVKNVKRNLEEIAIKTVERETTGSTKTAPGTSTGPNIENDLKNAAITALYRALLGVPRETIKPIDITKPQTDFDIRITDKTYTYDEKGERKEIPELTKYDRILAKEQK